MNLYTNKEHFVPTNPAPAD